MTAKAPKVTSVPKPQVGRKPAATAPALVAKPIAALPAPAEPGVKKPAMKIPDMVLSRAKARQRRQPRLEDGTLMFTPAEPAPGVVPKGHELAMDSSIVDVAAWGGLGLYASGISQGLTFLGYPLLAEMAQRPEFRRISEVMSTEMTRKWIKLHGKGDKDKTKQIAELSDEMKRLNVQGAFRELAEQDGFFGRAHLYLDLGSTDKRDELKTPIGDGRNKISQAKVKKGDLKRIKTVEAVWCYPANYNANDPLKPDWYKPTSWFVMGKELHASRLLTFVGREVPDMLKPAFSFGGLSLSQMAKPYVDNWLRTRQSVSDLVSNFSVSGIKTNMAATLQAGGEEMFKRLDLFNALRDNSGAMMLDKDTEEWFNVTTPLTTLDTLQAQSQEHIASVCGIPLIKLLGIAPAGLNASSDGEIRVFYDWIAAYQEQFFTSNLTRVLGFIQLSLWGKVDEDITFTFEPLWSLDAKALAEVRKLEAETGQILIDGGVISTEEERGRIAHDPETLYAGLDPADVPEVEDEEDQEDAGGVPNGPEADVDEDEDDNNSDTGGGATVHVQVKGGGKKPAAKKAAKDKK